MNRKEEIERIFRNSNSGNELFDAFQYSVKNQIGGIELYKILLANPTLTTDEIKMYAETLSKIFKQNACEIYSWTAKILDSYASSPCETEESINYLIKSWKSDQTKHEPLTSLIKMFNYDYDVSYNSLILNIVKEGVSNVKIKSEVYYALAELYERTGNIEQKRKYMQLAEKSCREEDQ